MNNLLSFRFSVRCSYKVLKISRWEGGFPAKKQCSYFLPDQAKGADGAGNLLPYLLKGAGTDFTRPGWKSSTRQTGRFVGSWASKSKKK